MLVKRYLLQAEADKIRQVCNFTDEELQIFNLRMRGKSNLEICFALHLSERTLGRRFVRIQQKIKTFSEMDK